eukprot:6210649-Pleurochrysis_carterae.AAC.5
MVSSARLYAMRTILPGERTRAAADGSICRAGTTLKEGHLRAITTTGRARAVSCEGARNHVPVSDQRLARACVHAYRDAEAVVHGEEAAALDGLHEAVDEARELRVARADIRREARPCVVERVDDCERAGAGEAARCDIGQEKRPVGAGGRRGASVTETLRVCRSM